MMVMENIELNPRVCGGKPVIKGTRIPVAVILDQLAAGETHESLLKSYPEMKRSDIGAVLLYAKASIENTTEVIRAVA